MIDTIVFDLDGTLIDTEKLYRKYWPMALADYGYNLTDEMALSLRSLGRPFAPEQFKKWFGEDFDYYKVRDRRKEYVKNHIAANGIDLKPGVVRLLDYMDSHNITSAIATATDIERTTSYLKSVGLEGRFEKIVCATMVEKGKPAPDIYRYVLEQLNCDPDTVLAVEDAPNGVISAYEAGLKVIFVPDQTDVDDSIKDKIFARCERIDDIIDLL